MKVPTLLGKKLAMTSQFDARGVRVGVTKVLVEPNTVLALRTLDKDGYMAAQIGTGFKKHISKPMQGQLKKANLEKAPRFIKETRLTEEFFNGLSLGDTIAINDVVKAGDLVAVQGISKGKGFQGGMKRWGFHGGPATHGQSDRSRAPGSIGSGTTPGRVYKGKHMAGHMGTDTVTVKNLTVFDVDPKAQTISLLGSIPGPRNGYVVVTVTGEDKRHIGPAKVAEPEVEEAIEETPAEETIEAAEAETANEEPTEESAEENKQESEEVNTEESTEDTSEESETKE